MSPPHCDSETAMKVEPLSPPAELPEELRPPTVSESDLVICKSEDTCVTEQGSDKTLLEPVSPDPVRTHCQWQSPGSTSRNDEISNSSIRFNTELIHPYQQTTRHMSRDMINTNFYQRPLSAEQQTSEMHPFPWMDDSPSSEDSGSFSDSFASTVSPISVTPDQPKCAACHGYISDRFILRVDGLLWHDSCLRCCRCNTQLGSQGKCHVKNGKIYCKHHYNEIYGTRCAKCARVVAPSDWIRRGGGYIYHLTCFSCSVCERLLSTGDPFWLNGTSLQCKAHASVSPRESPEELKGNKAKRQRTNFSQEQVELLQLAFTHNTNPIGEELGRIARKVGLSKRVTQVWFQNCRARQRKQAGHPALPNMPSLSES